MKNAVHADWFSVSAVSQIRNPTLLYTHAQPPAPSSINM